MIYDRTVRGRNFFDLDGILSRILEYRAPAAAVRWRRPPPCAGAALGKTTGWVHRMALDRRNVRMVRGVTYQKVDDQAVRLAAAA